MQYWNLCKKSYSIRNIQLIQFCSFPFILLDRSAKQRTTKVHVHGSGLWCIMSEYTIKIYIHVLVAVFKSRQIEIVFHEDKWWINASALLDHYGLSSNNSRTLIIHLTQIIAPFDRNV